ncbi:carboxymuconolactone decarboxylase family protein [Ralstonia sp. CHL-2022]|uniref:Carboxymuconolactone decarboxylase family protein n=1 Tax=Ralstonia mojiangensis TaxID=2953895 RepID=A0ABT2L8M2_9RALS|nr:carboxymuconolactone decarboxylase family protein [Ralstonia mojiangensis]MCT7298585.1 carboxymuconolactone decarboxylase family protein [Ralstonia mojiangensis]MCT7311771.1 carboxymuconolactone decarboxylase family protein [Ralstonia mojiangensis]
MNERISFGELPSGMVEALLAVESYVNHCGFEMRLLELLRYRISQLNGCAYCLDRHYKEGIHAGESAMRLYSLPVWEETPFYTERERAALRWADVVTLLADNAIGDDLVNEMLRHFNKQELTNLTLAVAQMNTWNRIAKPFAFMPGEFQAG